MCLGSESQVVCIPRRYDPSGYDGFPIGFGEADEGGGVIAFNIRRNKDVMAVKS